jgi:hypothetical protein
VRYECVEERRVKVERGRDEKQEARDEKQEARDEKRDSDLVTEYRECKQPLGSIEGPLHGCPDLEFAKFVHRDKRTFVHSWPTHFSK